MAGRKAIYITQEKNSHIDGVFNFSYAGGQYAPSEVPAVEGSFSASRIDGFYLILEHKVGGMGAPARDIPLHILPRDATPRRINKKLHDLVIDAVRPYKAKHISAATLRGEGYGCRVIDKTDFSNNR